MSAALDVVAFHIRPRPVAKRRLSETASEGHAFMYLILACLLFFVAQIPELVRLDLLAESQAPLNALAAGRFVGVAVFAPLLFYTLAALAALAFRAADFRISWLESRISLFWALLATAPSVLILGLLRGLTQADGILWPASALVGTLFAVFWAIGLSEAVTGRP